LRVNEAFRGFGVERRAQHAEEGRALRARTERAAEHGVEGDRALQQRGFEFVVEEVGNRAVQERRRFGVDGGCGLGRCPRGEQAAAATLFERSARRRLNPPFELLDGFAVTAIERGPGLAVGGGMRGQRLRGAAQVAVEDDVTAVGRQRDRRHLLGRELQSMFLEP